MDNIISYLEQLELTPSEAKTYLALVETGPITGRDLAQKSGMHYTQVYRCLDVLFKKGLVVKLVKKSQTHFDITEPKDSLPMLITQKTHDLQTIKADLPTILATLEGLQGEKEEDTDVEIKHYKGKTGVKRIYKEALEAKELRSYVNIATMIDIFPDNSDLFEVALKDTDIKIFEMLEDSTISRKQAAFQTKNAGPNRYFYKFLPPEIKLSAADILIYDGNVATVNVRNQITGVVLHDPDNYNNSKELFDLLWKVLPDVKNK